MAKGFLARHAGAALAASLALTIAGGAAFAAARSRSITPYLAQPGTQFYVEAFQEAAKENGWDVNVIDTKGDVAAVISRIEDAANQKVDAIVHQRRSRRRSTAGLETAKKAGVPVFGMDAGASPLLVTNVTSNGYEMAADTAAYVVNRIGGKGGVVMFVFDAFPPVQVRGVIADTIFKNNPDIKIIDRVTPDVQDGGIADSRAKMEAILAAHPQKGSIAAVWAAWDQPALGALQAIEAAGRDGRGHRDHRHGRQSAGARGDRQGRQFRGFDGAGLQRHRPHGRRRRQAHTRGRKDQAERDLRADQADHVSKREGMIGARRRLGGMSLTWRQ